MFASRQPVGRLFRQAPSAEPPLARARRARARALIGRRDAADHHVVVTDGADGWRPGRRWAPVRAAIVVALALASVTAAGAVLAFERQQARADGRAEAARSAAELEARLALAVRTLAGARAVIDPARPLDVDTAAFDAYAAAALEDPSLARLSWDVRVRAADRAAFEARVAPVVEVSGGGQAPPRPVHFPITFARTADPDGRALLGLDHLSEAHRAAAIQAAIATGAPRATVPVPVRLAGDPLGILVFQAVYRTAEPPAGVGARRAQVVGVMAGAYRLDALAGILGGHHVRVQDGARRLAGPASVPRPEFATLDVAGRRWSVAVAAPAPGLAAPLIVLFAGLVLTVAVAVSFWRGDRSERRLAAGERRFRAMADASPILIVTLDQDGGCSYVNREWRRATGRSPEGARGEGWLRAFDPADARAFRARFARARAAGARMDQELRMRRADGRVSWMLVRIAPTPDPAGASVAWVATLVDLTARRAAEHARQVAAVERALAREQEGLRRIATAIAWEEPEDAVFRLVAEEARATLAARAARVLDGPGADGRVVALASRDGAPAPRDGRDDQTEVRVPISVAGRPWGALAVDGPTSPDPRPLAHLAELVALAVTSADARRRLAATALTDALTGLANRRAFDARLAVERARVRRSGDPLSLVMLDIDEFKGVNDTYGHLAGDAVLREVATALAETTRDGEMVARVGGEEFAWILVGAGAGAAFRAAERARRAVASRRVDPVGAVTVSAGVASLLDADESADELIARADRALYAAKEAGRDRAVADAGDAGAPASGGALIAG